MGLSLAGRKRSKTVSPHGYGAPPSQGGGLQPYGGSGSARSGPTRSAMQRGTPRGTSNPSGPRGEAARRAAMFRRAARTETAPRGNSNGRRSNLPTPGDQAWYDRFGDDVPRNERGRPVTGRGGYRPGVNWMISGNAGHDPTLPGLTGDVHIRRGAPLEGEVWYYGHGPEGNRANGTYGPFGRNGETQMPWLPDGQNYVPIPGGANPLSPADLDPETQGLLGGLPTGHSTRPAGAPADAGTPTTRENRFGRPSRNLVQDALEQFDSPSEAEAFLQRFYPNFRLPR